MTERELFEAIGHVDDDLILAADKPVRRHRKPPVYWRNLISVAACACIFLGGVALWNQDFFRAGQPETAAYDSSAAEAAQEEPMVGAAAPQAEDTDEGATQKDAATSSIALGVARYVQINGVQYAESPALIDFTADRDPDGVIETSVGRDAFPDADNCSNFGTGYSYWINEDGTVTVEIDGVYTLFAAE